MTSRILVTAALGNIGREVVRECRALGLEVRAADLDAAAIRQRLGEGDSCRLDFLDRETWAPALAGCDQLFLLRPPPIGDMEKTLLPFLDAARRAGVSHVVFSSVSGADRMKWVPHHKVERALIEGPDGWTILRPGFFAQNLHDAYRRDILEDGRIYLPAAGGKIAFIDVRDVAAVAARVHQRPDDFRGQALTLTGPMAVTFAEVARLLSESLGREVRYEAASIPGYLWHLAVRRRMPLMQVAVQTILHVGLRRGDAEAVDPSVERLLGCKARPIGDYVSEACAGWQRAAHLSA